MAHDPGVAELLRGDLADLEDLDERRMFGALGFMWGGHLLCAALAEGAMIRVGKPGMEAALALPGVAPMRTGAREMGGFVAVSPDGLADDAARDALLRLARACVEALPAR
ncbi:MAG: TfoX/Sxy family protein [Tranquillimonas sp.]